MPCSGDDEQLVVGNDRAELIAAASVFPMTYVDEENESHPTVRRKELT